MEVAIEFQILPCGLFSHCTLDFRMFEVCRWDDLKDGHREWLVLKLSYRISHAFSFSEVGVIERINFLGDMFYLLNIDIGWLVLVRILLKVPCIRFSSWTISTICPLNALVPLRMAGA